MPLFPFMERSIKRKYLFLRLCHSHNDYKVLCGSFFRSNYRGSLLQSCSLSEGFLEKVCSICVFSAVLCLSRHPGLLSGLSLLPWTQLSFTICWGSTARVKPVPVDGPHHPMMQRTLSEQVSDINATLGSDVPPLTETVIFLGGIFLWHVMELKMNWYTLIISRWINKLSLLLAAWASSLSF